MPVISTLKHEADGQGSNWGVKVAKVLWSDKRKFVWVLSLLLVVAFFATSWLSYRVAHSSLQDQIEQNALPLTSDNIYSEIQQDLLKPIFISSLMAQDTFLRDWALGAEESADPLVRYLKEIQKRYNTVTSFFVSEKTKRYYHSSGVLKQVTESDAQDDWYFRVRRLPQDQHYEVNIDFDTASPEVTTVFVYYKVYDYQGELLGVTGVGLAIETVRELIEHYQTRYNRRIYFVGRDGKLALRSNELQVPDSIHQREGLKTIATQLLTSPGGSYRFIEESQEVFLNARLVPEFSWYLMVEQHADPAEQDLQNTLFLNLAISLAVTLVILFIANLTLGRYQRRLEAMASTDKLTGSYNRQVFEHQMTQLAANKQQNYSVILLDIDHFKAINDQHGHLVGDSVLQRLAETIKTQIRQSDLCCRWGGEEFAILLPQCDGLVAYELAEKIRSQVENQPITVNQSILRLQISCGVAQALPGESQEQVLSRADQSLYRAKQQGRNQSILASGDKTLEASC